MKKRTREIIFLILGLFIFLFFCSSISAVCVLFADRNCVSSDCVKDSPTQSLLIRNGGAGWNTECVYSTDNCQCRCGPDLEVHCADISSSIDVSCIIPGQSTTYCTSFCTDEDNDNYDNCASGTYGDDGKAIDCKPSNSAIHPNALEVCNGKDDDCDTQIDEGLTCTSIEVCNGVDDDGDGSKDEDYVCHFKYTLDVQLARHWTFDIADGSNLSKAVDTSRGKNGTVFSCLHIPSKVIREAYSFSPSSDIFTEILSLGTSQAFWHKSENIWHYYVNSSGVLYKDGVQTTANNYANIFSFEPNLTMSRIGVIDEVAIWNRVLESSEVSRLFKGYILLSNGNWNIYGVSPVIGNGILELTEECDDGNTNNGDCCSSSGLIETGCRCNLVYGKLSICCKNECSEGDVLIQCDENSFNTYNSSECEKLSEANGGCWVWGDFGGKEECGTGEECVSVDYSSDGCYEINIDNPISLCDDYTIQATCEEDDSLVCDYTLNQHLIDVALEKGYYSESDVPDNFCDGNNPIYVDTEVIDPYASCSYYADNCACNWDSGSQKCGSNYTEIKSCQTASGEETTEYGVCNFLTTNFEDKCESIGYMVYTRQANWFGDEGYDQEESLCQDYTKEYKCVSTAKLPFFGWTECFISFCLIELSYVFYFIYVKYKR